MRFVDSLEEDSIVALKNLSSILRVSLLLAHIRLNIALVLKAVRVAAAKSGEVPEAALSPMKGHPRRRGDSEERFVVPYFKVDALTFSSA